MFLESGNLGGYGAFSTESHAMHLKTINTEKSKLTLFSVFRRIFLLEAGVGHGTAVATAFIIFACGECCRTAAADEVCC